jgi:hypothetical protein
MTSQRLNEGHPGLERLLDYWFGDLDPANTDRVDAHLFGCETVLLRDVPFDAASGEVVLLPALEAVRQMPAHVMRVRLLAVEAAGARELGHYSFHHQSHAGA